MQYLCTLLKYIVTPCSNYEILSCCTHCSTAQVFGFAYRNIAITRQPLFSEQLLIFFFCNTNITILLLLRYDFAVETPRIQEMDNRVIKIQLQKRNILFSCPEMLVRSVPRNRVTSSHSAAVGGNRSTFKSHFVNIHRNTKPGHINCTMNSLVVCVKV